MASLPYSLDTEQLRACVLLLQRSGRTIESFVQGDSMGSTLPDGSRIRISRAEPSALRNGDIVACITDGFLSAHRLVYGAGEPAAARGFLITQGDAWILCDPPRHVSTLLGVVEECFIGGRWTRPAASPARSPADQRSADRHAAFMAFCLRRSVRLAGLVSRRLLTLYTLREKLRTAFRT